VFQTKIVGFKNLFTDLFTNLISLTLDGVAKIRSRSHWFF